MTTINLDQFEERLMQRADAEQNIANRLYQGNASKEEYMKATVTASVLREVAHSIAQMKEEFTVTTVVPEKQNVEVTPGILREYVQRLINELSEITQNQRINSLACKVQKVLDATEGEGNRTQAIGHGRLQAMLAECLRIFRNIQPITSSEAGFGDLTRNQYDQFIRRLRNVVEGNGFADRQYPGAEAWELEELVEAKDERISQLKTKISNLEGHLSKADKNIEKLEKKVSYFEENRNWIDKNFQKLSDKYVKFRAILRDRSQQLIHELNGVSNTSDLDAVRCRNLAEDMLLLSKGEIRAADAERVPDPKKAIMDVSIDHFLDIVEDFDAEMLQKTDTPMSPRVYNILRKTEGWTVRDVYEDGFKLKGFGKKSMQEFESLIDKMVEIAHEENQ